MKTRKFGTCTHPGEIPSCNGGLPFSSYIDPSKASGSVDLIASGGGSLDIVSASQQDLCPEDPHHRLSLTSSISQTSEQVHPSDRSVSVSSIGQDVNQNLTPPDLDKQSGDNRRRGSITFVITDHSDDKDDGCAFEPSPSAPAEIETKVETMPKSAFVRKQSTCESIPEEPWTQLEDVNNKMQQQQSTNLAQATSTGILRLPNPSIRKSGRSMSECSDYSLTSDGKQNTLHHQLLISEAPE